MFRYLKDKFINRIRQFGLPSGLVQIVMFFVRIVYKSKQDIVFVIPAFAGYVFEDKNVKPLSVERIERSVREGEIGKTLAKRLIGFLNNGSKGVYVEIDKKMAGYGLVQFYGEYHFGTSGKMAIPNGYAIAKNLYVFPEFRGQKIGQILNAARLSIIPAGCVPVGFIIPENRYAIRNWESYRFERILLVKQWQWFWKPWKMEVKVFSDNTHAAVLKKALLDGHERA